ncbi:Decarboxylase yanB [Hyphodiscus hymeniophilus]|uniref:6-methylsalicylate decarboxylase n=1 Tax=Hyphodiscus hymeniophilus TaxID=353542 RepID=A0A9P6VDY6_9HELO|nr:Decarboxylase yanB [Hyphodiscus hymeniophilus]
MMGDLSITKSILSISSPGVCLFPGDNRASRNLARQCNEYAGDIVRRRPTQFGFWAVLPLPDVGGAISEIPYALDTLHAAGFALETNYHGTYLGDPLFDAVFAELNRRKATVFVHPTTPCMRHTGSHDHTAVTVLNEFPNPMFEFMFDTARAIINLLLSGTIKRCPDITFVIPHAGGAIPPVIERFTSFATEILSLEVEISSNLVREAFLQQFYFDLAGFPFPDQIHGLLRFVEPQKLLYGSDYPFTPAKGVVSLAKKMDIGLEKLFLDDSVRRGIYVDNAKRLLREFKTSL